MSSASLHEFLEKIEWTGRHGAGYCPECDQQQPLDAGNPREWENHTADCVLGKAIAETAPAAEPADEPAA